MKTFQLITLSLFTLAGIAQETDNWVTNFEEAKRIAGLENKIILMSFQGSDWCNNCMRLEKLLFQDEAFKTFAKDKLVLLKLDFPARKKNKLSEEQTKHNEALAEKYNDDGSFPKVLLFNDKGERLGAMKYPLNSAEEYLASLSSFTDK